MICVQPRDAAQTRPASRSTPSVLPAPRSPESGTALLVCAPPLSSRSSPESCIPPMWAAVMRHVPGHVPSCKAAAGLDSGHGMDPPARCVSARAARPELRLYVVRSAPRSHGRRQGAMAWAPFASACAHCVGSCPDARPFSRGQSLLNDALKRAPARCHDALRQGWERQVRESARRMRKGAGGEGRVGARKCGCVFDALLCMECWAGRARIPGAHEARTHTWAVGRNTAILRVPPHC